MLASECGDGLVLRPPKTTLLCKFPCLLNFHQPVWGGLPLLWSPLALWVQGAGFRFHLGNSWGFESAKGFIGVLYTILILALLLYVWNYLQIKSLKKQTIIPLSEYLYYYIVTAAPLVCEQSQIWTMIHHCQGGQIVGMLCMFVDWP